MIAKISIDLDLSFEDSISFLKNNKVSFDNSSFYLRGLDFIGRWKNLQNPNNFELDLYSKDYMSATRIKCKLIEISENKTKLKIWIMPPIFGMVFFGFLLIMVIYTISQFGVANYGTDGFWPSIIIPSLCASFVFGLVFLRSYLGGKWMKKQILKSFNAQLNK